MSPDVSNSRPTQRSVVAGILFALLGCAAVFACGGSIEPEQIDTTNKFRDGGKDGSISLIDGGRKDSSVLYKDGGPKDTGNTFVEPGCPNPPPPNTQYQCNVAEQKGCKPGQACTPFADYPTDPCDPETYGSVCIPAGTGVQGSPCDGQGSCAAGYICVITGAGTSCAKYCDLTKPNACGNGLICDAVDVSGVGVCN